MPEAVRLFRSKVVPLDAENVDTDQIVPARYLKVTDKAGLAEALFHDWRFGSDGAPLQPPFVLDRPGMAGRRIGSSRTLVVAQASAACTATVNPTSIDVPVSLRNAQAWRRARQSANKRLERSSVSTNAVRITRWG